MHTYRVYLSCVSIVQIGSHTPIMGMCGFALLAGPTVPYTSLGLRFSTPRSAYGLARSGYVNPRSAYGMGSTHTRSAYGFARSGSPYFACSGCYRNVVNISLYTH